MAIGRKWLISKANYYADFVIVPVMVVVTSTVLGFNPLLFITGVILWTLIEYLMHRYLFHVIYRNDHWFHHLHESLYVGVSTIKTSSVLIALLAVAWLCGIIPIFNGFAIGYLFYIIVHDAIHHPNFMTRYIPALFKAHMRHHEVGDENNFGVTTPLWDKLFGTYKI